MDKYLQNGKFKAILAIVGLVFMFGYFFATTFIPVPKGNTADTTMLNGAFIGVISTIFGFYFAGMDRSHKNNP